MDSVLWELYVKMVKMESHRAEVSLLRTAWQAPLWAGKYQRIRNTLT